MGFLIWTPTNLKRKRKKHLTLASQVFWCKKLHVRIIQRNLREYLIRTKKKA